MKNRSWSGKDERAFLELPYHLVCSTLMFVVYLFYFICVVKNLCCSNSVVSHIKSTSHLVLMDGLDLSESGLLIENGVMISVWHTLLSS